MRTKIDSCMMLMRVTVSLIYEPVQFYFSKCKLDKNNTTRKWAKDIIIAVVPWYLFVLSSTLLAFLVADNVKIKGKERYT
jgi:hypothetical protein